MLSKYCMTILTFFLLTYKVATLHNTYLNSTRSKQCFLHYRGPVLNFCIKIRYCEYCEFCKFDETAKVFV